jgi:hypothetical protein
MQDEAALPRLDVPLHDRTITYEAWVTGPDEIRIAGHFRDRRPWQPDDLPNGVLHEMDLVVRVRPSDRVITSVDASMKTYPHAECPSITPSFDQLAGLSVVGGFGWNVRERFSGVRGCAHLHEIARGLGPAAVQALIAYSGWTRPPGRVQAEPSPATRNSCHVWAAGGPGEQKFDAGWRLGGDAPHPGYPVPPVEWFRSNRGQDDAHPGTPHSRDQDHGLT